jgi:hypothetical protein
MPEVRRRRLVVHKVQGRLGLRIRWLARWLAWCVDRIKDYWLVRGHSHRRLGRMTYLEFGLHAILGKWRNSDGHAELLILRGSRRWNRTKLGGAIRHEIKKTGQAAVRHQREIEDVRKSNHSSLHGSTVRISLLS